jgi:anti-anti-sigma regulatory factor
MSSSGIIVSELIMGSDYLSDRDVYVLRPVGSLTITSRHELRRSVQQHLAVAPTAIIIDLDGTRLIDRIAAATFVAIRHDAARSGPGVALLLCGVADPYITRRIQALLPRQPIFHTLDHAIQAVDASPSEGHWALARVAPGLQAPFDAMAAIVDACRRWDLPTLVRPALTTTFTLCQTAFRCPPGPETIAALYQPTTLRIRLRVQPDDEPVQAPCTLRRPPRGFRHRITPTGHILWTSLAVRAGDAPVA